MLVMLLGQLNISVVVLRRFISCDFSAGSNGHIAVSWYNFIRLLYTARCSQSDLLGTGFVITGGRRPGYGPFSVMLDGQQLFSGNLTPESSPINNTLASSTGLSNKQHTVVLTNTGGEPIDIDTITFEPQIGSTGCVRLFAVNIA